MTGLVRRFLRKRNKSSSRVHYCYIIIGTEFKEKNILEQDELFCCVIISSGLKEKKKKNVCPFLLLENLRPLSPPWEPQTPFASSGTPDFLSTLRIDSLRYRDTAINVQFSRSVMSDSCDPMNCSTSGFPVHHQLLELTQSQVHRVGDAIDMN